MEGVKHRPAGIARRVAGRPASAKVLIRTGAYLHPIPAAARIGGGAGRDSAVARVHCYCSSTPDDAAAQQGRGARGHGGEYGAGDGGDCGGADGIAWAFSWC